MHREDLRGDDRLDGGYVVCVVWEVEEDGVGDGVGFLYRVNPCKALIFDEDRAVR